MYRNHVGLSASVVASPRLVYKNTYAFLRRALNHSVPEVQDEGAALRLLGARGDRLSDLLLRAEQHPRIDVAADRLLLPEDLAGVFHVDAPVDAEHVTSHVLLVLQIAAPPVREVDDGRVGAGLLDELDAELGVGLREG
eukprot:scaffold442_cov268-Pinguiococcus_pyrenoidosus.AAC.45